MCRIILFIIASIMAFSSLAQTASEEEQRRIIASLEASIARDEKALSSIKNDKASAQKRVNILTKQIKKRESLIAATNKRIKTLTGEVNASEKKIKELGREHSNLENSCAEIIRAAYRSYRFNTWSAYILSATSFAQIARNIASLRTATIRRSENMKHVISVKEDVEAEKRRLENKKAELDKQKKNLDNQKAKLDADRKAARSNVKEFSQKEKNAMELLSSHQAELDQAVAKLRSLTKGNKAGDSFNSKTSKLHIPVVGGYVKKYKGNMAEIVGRENARIISIYEGKVMDVKRNKVTNKFDVYIAHGEYITSYANLSSVSVSKNSTVKKDETIGVIGSSVNPSTFEIEYKLVFGIYAPNPSVKMQAANCFK